MAAAWPDVRGEGMKQESKRWLSRALVVAALLGVGVLVWQVSRPTGLG
ncbi:glycoside hydrolase family 43, partial [Pseudomonas aeruginosa]|nr:glycoside hydrolase family 43 [Pseudomonas aeruginosa]